MSIVFVWVLVFLFSGFGIGFLNAFVVRDLWQWFVSPLGVPSISWAQAYGLDVLVTYLTMTRMSLDYDSPNKWKTLGIGVAVALVCWAMGWALHVLMTHGF